MCPSFEFRGCGRLRSSGSFARCTSARLDVVGKSCGPCSLTQVLKSSIDGEACLYQQYRLMCGLYTL